LLKEQGQEKSQLTPAESERPKFLKNRLLFAFEFIIFSYLSTQFIFFKPMIAPRSQI